MISEFKIHKSSMLYDNKTGVIFEKPYNEFAQAHLNSHNKKYLQALQDMLSKSAIDGSVVELSSDAIEQYFKLNGFTELILKTTDECNLRCKYCVYSDHYPYTSKYSHNRMSLDVAVSAVDYYLNCIIDQQLYLHKTPFIAFYGGEPLLNFDIIKVLLVLCIPIPALILISVSAAKKMAKQIKESLDSNAEYAGKIQDSLRGMETVKSQGLEEYENIKINQYNSSALEKQKKQSNTLNAFTVGMGSASSIITAIVYLIGGLFFISGDLTMGSFVAISTYAGKLYSPIFSYIGTSIVVQPAIIALNRVAKFFFESSVTKEDKTQSIDSIQSIDFCDVSFSYNEDDDVIKNFSMTIKSGDKVQITGKNGSGKSTLIRLLMQLISPTKGVIYINGINAVNVSKSSVISQISYVSQRNYVFNESIRANITYGIDHPDQSKVDELISQLHLDIIEERLSSEGNDLKIGENGCRLSGGEIQKVCIARAFLLDRSIFIFDEAMSNLDVDTISYLKKRIQESNATWVLIDHQNKLSGFKTIVLKSE